MSTMTTSAFYQQFVAYLADGRIDVRKGVKRFEEEFNAWIKAQDAIKPVILAELKHYKKLGEVKLIDFVLHQLRLPPTGENVEKVKVSLEELRASNKIIYSTGESGQRRGRGVGWQLKTAANEATTEAAQ